MKKLINMGGVRHLFPIVSLKMKLTYILTIVSLIQIQANSYSQTKKISLDVKNISVQQIIKEIEAQSKFKFLLNRKDVNTYHNVSLKVRKKPITDVLSQLFKNPGAITKYDLPDLIAYLSPRQVLSISPRETNGLKASESKTKESMLYTIEIHCKKTARTPSVLKAI